MATPTKQTIFEDNFNGVPDASWSWLHEHSGYWRILNKGLEIRVEPGKADTVKNALVRSAPDRKRGTFAIEVTVTNDICPTELYEQGGITWYNGGKPVLKLVKELVDGELYIIPGRVAMPAKSVRLRLLVSVDSWHAQYCPEGETKFQTAATGKLPAPADDFVSIQCYHGPPHEEHWIRFENFCIQSVSKS